MRLILFSFSLLACFSCKKDQQQITEVCTKEKSAEAGVDTIARLFINQFCKLDSTSLHRYDAKDNLGNQLDGLKVIKYDDVFVGVYHTYRNGYFSVNVATSVNLLDWTFKVSIAKQASQPYIYQSENKELYVVWEQEPNNHLRIALFQNLDSLISGQASKTKSIPRKLSTFAEGTPSISGVVGDKVFLNFHYFFKGKRDLNARGVLKDFNMWQCEADKCLDHSIGNFGIMGNIGDRDYIKFLGHDFIIIEGQRIFNDFGTWQCYLYHEATGLAWHIPFQSHFGSSNFANPTISVLNLNGKDVLFLSLFIPSERAVLNEGGEFIGYFYL